MIALSVVWLVLLLTELIWGTSEFFEVFGIAIWVIFLVEFAVRLALAPRKVTFLRRNWLTTIALAAPGLRVFRVLRLLRVARATRALRLVRIIGAANRGMNSLRRSMARRGAGYVLLLTLLVTALGAAGMWTLEAPERGFESYGHALWWTTMILVGMGTDYWPRTPEGRLLCLLLAIYGFAMFGYITAMLASFFLGQEERQRKADAR
jgi:voltage-gated potassium channel